jgi:hypothetical protein
MEAESTRESRQGLAIALALATALVAVNLATSAGRLTRGER